MAIATMIAADSFHFVTVGTTPELVRNLWDPVARGSEFRFSHIMHPRSGRKRSSLQAGSESNRYYFVDDGRLQLPATDRVLLSSLETEEAPTVHNMILSDRVVSQLPYDEALRYATFLTRRLMEILGRVKPMAVIGGFDAIHGSLALAVARKMGIPWYALHFSVIPEGLACFCDRASPAARVGLRADPSVQTAALAARALTQFEAREIVAPAYIAPRPRSFAEKLSKASSRVSTLARMLSGRPAGGMFRYTEPRSKYSVTSAIRHLSHATRARKAAARSALLRKPPAYPYVMFGLHMQPESSIDVWAPMFSNQLWVIELLSRSIPPTHKLLVKIHKSDTANHSIRRLREMSAFPGVELIAPFADTRRFIENADLIVMIQGTMGLEAALIGKPVIMVGQSPFTIFPSVSPIGEITELPALVRQKLEEERPSRSSILESYSEYLRAFAPASTNDWARKREAREIDDYRRLFERLREYVVSRSPVSAKPGRALI